MKRIAFVAPCVAGVIAAGYGLHPDEFARYAHLAERSAPRVWETIEANPVPVCLAFGTFLLTVTVNRKGKHRADPAGATAVRVAAAPAPLRDDETPVVRRAKARATWTQLLADQIALQNRHRKLPEEVTKAEKEACYTEQAVADAERALAEKQKTHEAAARKLAAVRKEKATGDAELAEIAAELKKLADVV